MTITTPRLLLRQWRDDDLPAYAALAGDPRVAEFFPFPLPARVAYEQANAIRKHVAEKGWGGWAVEVKGKVPFAGWVGLGPPDFQGLAPPFKHVTPCIEIGWRLAYECWGHGYATEAAMAAARFGFETLGLEEIISFAPMGNLRSRRVMAKLGMTHDPNENFYHPCAPPNHPLGPCALYRLPKPQ